MFKAEIIKDNKIFQNEISSFKSNFMQTVNWAEFKKDYGWDNIKIIFKDDSKNIGFVIILIKKVKYFKLFYIPRGPIIEDKYLKSAISKIEEIAKNSKASLLKIEPDIEYNEKYIEYFKKYKISKDFIQPIDTAFIDLKSDLIKNIPSKKRGRIRNKFNLKFVETNNLNDFFDVYKNNAILLNYKSRDITYFQNLIEHFGENVKIFKVLNNKKIIASSFNIIYNNTMTYLYSGTNKAYNHMYPGYFLIFNSAMWGKEHNLEYYDLWGISEKNKSWKGFSEFKLNLGGRPFKYLGSLNLYINPIYSYIYKLIKEL